MSKITFFQDAASNTIAAYKNDNILLKIILHPFCYNSLKRISFLDASQGQFCL